MYYALWYYFNDGERSTNSISLDSKSLDILHEESIKNPDNLYHQYKKYIISIKSEPIDCYIYNDKYKNLELIENYNDLLNGKLYASQDLLSNNLTEILVYLTKEQHEIWRKCANFNDNENRDKEYPDLFYDNLISLNEVEVNVYYNDGIMNA